MAMLSDVMASTAKLTPRQQPSTLVFVPSGSPLTFQYTTNQPANNNYIGIWSDDDQDAPATPFLVYRSARGASGTIQIPMPDDLHAGKYNAWLITHAGTVLAGPAPATFGVCAKPGESACLDGTVCAGRTPQCTVDAREAKAICCAAGQKAFYGKCYDAPNGIDIDVCVYSQKDRTSGQVCNRTDNKYCACLAGGSYAACKCCKATQYLAGSSGECVDK